MLLLSDGFSLAFTEELDQDPHAPDEHEAGDDQNDQTAGYYA